MYSAARVGLVVLGAAMAVYGAASLTGGWLGTPPWVADRPADAVSGSDYGNLEGSIFDHPRPHEPPGFTRYAPLSPEFIAASERSRANDEPRLPGWCAVGLGLALVAVGAWPRRRTCVKQITARWPRRVGSD